jgi:hypothetical protein
MARTPANLPEGSRITDYLSLGVITKTFPLERVRSVLAVTGKTSVRERDLPAHVVVYYAIALALYMQSSYREVLRCLLEGLQWLMDPALTVRVSGNSGISQARTRLGWEPMRQLHDEVVKPIAVASTRGAWYGQWRLVSLDGSTMDVADEKTNDEVFGRPGSSRGSSAFPKLRFVSLVENGTHVLFGTRMSPYATGENTLAKEVVGALDSGMLCLADRGFFGYEMWQRALATQAQLLWRIKANAALPCDKRLADGSYLSRIYPCDKDKRLQTNATVLRVIEYQLEGVADAEPIYRPGAPGVLRPSDGALRRSRADARGRAEGRPRSRCPVVHPRRACRQAQTPRLQRYSPLCRGKRSMSACSTRSCKIGLDVAEAGEICAASSAR